MILPIYSLDGLNKDRGTMKARERYFIAASYCMGTNVLEISCASGYGSNILAQQANSILACDIDQKALSFCKQHWSNDRVIYKHADLSDPQLDLGKFNCVVSLETIEHVPTPLNVTIKLLSQHVVSNGILIFSCPINEQCEPNQTHKHTRISIDSLKQCVKEIDFQLVSIIGQHNVLDGTDNYDNYIFVCRRA